MNHVFEIFLEFIQLYVQDSLAVTINEQICFEEMLYFYSDVFNTLKFSTTRHVCHLCSRSDVTAY